ncbi:MAG: nitroreductase [Firmicutes bacterium]|nr:nitroreductase [Bacillota bacterium]
MSFIELAQKRYSVRQYQTKQVEQGKIDAILSAGRLAPTAVNKQPQKILVVNTTEGLDKLNKAANIHGAPLAFIVCADHTISWKRRYDGMDSGIIDVTIVTTHMMMAATELGLGSIWVCHFNPDILKAEFALPQEIEPVNILGVGYAAGPPKSPDRFAHERKPLTDTVFYEKL